MHDALCRAAPGPGTAADPHRRVRAAQDAADDGRSTPTCGTPTASPDAIAAHDAVLREHCRDLGRDEREIARTVTQDAVIRDTPRPRWPCTTTRRDPRPRREDRLGQRRPLRAARPARQPRSRTPARRYQAVGVDEVIVDLPPPVRPRDHRPDRRGPGRARRLSRRTIPIAAGRRTGTMRRIGLTSTSRVPAIGLALIARCRRHRSGYARIELAGPEGRSGRSRHTRQGPRPLGRHPLGADRSSSDGWKPESIPVPDRAGRSRPRRCSEPMPTATPMPNARWPRSGHRPTGATGRRLGSLTGSRRATPRRHFVIAAMPGALVVSGSVCCTVEEHRAMWWSDDGRDWERLVLPPEMLGVSFLSIAGGPQGFVGVGVSHVGNPNDPAEIGEMWTSPNGRVWEEVDPDAAGIGPGAVSSVAWTGSHWLAVGKQAGGDCLGWRRVAVPRPSRLVQGGGRRPRSDRSRRGRAVWRHPVRGRDPGDRAGAGPTMIAVRCEDALGVGGPARRGAGPVLRVARQRASLVRRWHRLAAASAHRAPARRWGATTGTEWPTAHQSPGDRSRRARTCGRRRRAAEAGSGARPATSWGRGHRSLGTTGDRSAGRRSFRSACTSTTSWSRVAGSSASAIRSGSSRPDPTAWCGSGRSCLSAPPPRSGATAPRPGARPSPTRRWSGGIGSASAALLGIGQHRAAAPFDRGDDLGDPPRRPGRAALDGPGSAR